MSDSLDRFIAFLPQKKPFLFLDGLLEVELGRRAVAHKTFPPGDRVFENHLPDRPLVPGVIIIEALAQLSGIALIPDAEGRPITGYLAEVSRMRFRRLVHPGERLTLTSELIMRLGSAARFAVKAEVGAELVAEGQVTVGGMQELPGPA